MLRVTIVTEEEKKRQAKHVFVLVYNMHFFFYIYIQKKGSTSARQNECGGETVYCPVGSGMPLNVTLGYYSTGQTLTTRTGQVCM
jgi:hypothetical protein